jgi:hypothetical protein
MPLLSRFRIYQLQVPVAIDAEFYALATSKVTTCLQRAGCVKQSGGLGKRKGYVWENIRIEGCFFGSEKCTTKCSKWLMLVSFFKRQQIVLKARIVHVKVQLL